METLSIELRRQLERTVVEACDIAEAGARGVLEALTVPHHEPYGHMSSEPRTLRNAAGVDRVAVTDHGSGAWTDGCRVEERGALQEEAVREEVCRVMEGGREVFSGRWARLGQEV